MATTYTWSITSMSTLPQVNGFTDVVVTAQWLCVGINGQTTANFDGICKFTISPNDPNYTPYNQLTEQKTLEWVFNSLGENGVSSTEQCIEGQINSILNPPVIPSAQPLPW